MARAVFWRVHVKMVQRVTTSAECVCARLAGEVYTVTDPVHLDTMVLTVRVCVRVRVVCDVTPSLGRVTAPLASLAHDALNPVLVTCGALTVHRCVVLLIVTVGC